jgi:hypothetical protein
MKVLRLLCPIALLLWLTGCGTYIPSQRDWPNDSTRNVQDMNSALAYSIVCELSYAVTLAIKTDLRLAPQRSSRRVYSRFLADWGVEVATDLTVSENSNIRPSGLWAPVSPLSAIFTLSGGIGGSAIATNENKYNVFYPLSALYKPDLFHENSKERPCRNPTGNKEGSPLVDIDLKLLPLLGSRIQLVTLNIADAPSKEEKISGEKNVLTQTVSIKETVSGDITPTWAFTTGSVNPSGTFLSAGRERTHQVVFTFGQLAPGGRSLTFLAETTHLNEQLQAGLRNSRFTQ